MPPLHLVADVISHYEELIQNYPARSISANNIGNRFCLQRLVSVVKFSAEQGLALRGDENVESPESLSKKFYKTFFKQILKKEDAMLSATGFATVPQIANHCQIPCCIIKFFYS